MKHEFDINCQVGDFLRYYGNMRFAVTYKIEKAPTELVVDVDLNDTHDRSWNIILTDGFINEFDKANTVVDPDGNTSIAINKRLKVCKANKYAIKISYTKTGVAYTGISIYIYMSDLSKIDEIYNEIPNDIYFW